MSTRVETRVIHTGLSAYAELPEPSMWGLRTQRIRRVLQVLYTYLPKLDGRPVRCRRMLQVRFLGELRDAR